MRGLFDAAEILGQEINQEEKARVDTFFYDLLKPEVFWGPSGYIVTHNKNFESSCVAISQTLSKDPKKMNVLEYYQTIEDLNNQAKKMSKNAKSNHK